MLAFIFHGLSLSLHYTSVCPMEVDVYIDMQISTAGTINVLSS